MSSLSHYARMLRTHDWTYRYSDDYNQFAEGAQQRERIHIMHDFLIKKGGDKARLADALWQKYNRAV